MGRWEGHWRQPRIEEAALALEVAACRDLLRAPCGTVVRGFVPTSAACAGAEIGMGVADSHARSGGWGTDDGPELKGGYGRARSALPPPPKP